jgi:multicomponent Na+:H+ antiporter subunit D
LNNMLHDNLTVLPILIPLTGAMITLMLRQTQRLQAGCALGSMILSLAASAWLTGSVWQGGQPVVFHSGGWSPPFGITLVGDLLSAVFVFMSQLVLTTGIIYAIGSKDAVVKYPTFYPLFLMLATSLTGAILTGDLFNMYVFAELMVISGTVLTAVSDDRYGTEAAYKYFYISLTASFFMLFAIGSLYVCYGTLNMADLAKRIPIEGVQPLLLPGIGFLMATFMVKSAVFPFHFWQPDFHAAAPTSVSAMLSSVVVKLGVYGFLRMTTLLFVSQAPVIRGILLMLGVAGVIFGGLSAVGTHNVKRMLAYSTIAQIGFILIGIGWGTPLAIAAAIVFAFNHSLVKAAMLMLAGYVASRAPIKSAAFDVVTGVGKLIPASGALFLIGSLGLAGIPPTNGFISKMMLFLSGIDTADFGALLLMAIGSLLTLVYTNRAFIRIWWQRPPGSTGAKPTGDHLLAPAILIVLVLILGLWAEPLVQVARETSLWLDSPGLYIQAVLGG